MRSHAQEVFIVATKRTPFGSFLGKLSGIPGVELASNAVRAVLASRKIDPIHVDEVILGNVLSAGTGQNPAKQVVFGADLPTGVRATNVNKACASGMKAVAFAYQQILVGQSNCIIAGGFESMSNAPSYIASVILSCTPLQTYNLEIKHCFQEKGNPFGHQSIADGCAVDGLTDVYNQCPMGVCAEKIAHDFHLSRQIQDQYTVTSYERALAAMQSGKLADQIMPLKLNERENMKYDEEPHLFKRDRIPLLNPAFDKKGTITAASAAKLNDGASVLVLMSEAKVKELKLEPLARIVSFAECDIDPIDFCIAETQAIQKAIARAGMKQSQISLYEINEAYAASVLANIKLLDLDFSQVNIHGGALSIGHPLAASGARVISSLVSVLRLNKGKYGVASICNGGGGGTSMVIENLQ